MNRRQRKKHLKKWLANVVYIEGRLTDHEPIDVGVSAWLEQIKSSEK